MKIWLLTAAGAVGVAHAQEMMSLRIEKFKDPAMYPRGIELRSAPKPAPPRGITAGLLDEQGRFRGTSTRICLDGRTGPEAGPPGSVTLFNLDAPAIPEAPSDRDWYISPAHVVESIKNVTLESGLVLRKEFVDSLADLALLSSTRSSAPCAYLAPSLGLGSVFDIESAFNTPEVWIEIEAPRPDGQPQPAQRMSTVVSTSMGQGIPGRDATGPLMVLLARGFRGQSGGALSGQPNDSGYLWGLKKLIGLDLNHPYRRLVGLILAVDSEGRRLVALPAPTIWRALQNYFQHPERFSVAPRTRSGPQGTQYLSTKTIHYRSWLQEAGIGDLADGGIGDMADGGAATAASSPNAGASPKSGLGMGDKRWLSWGSEWSEFEALPQDLINKIYSGETPQQGIYEQAGQLRASDAETPLPEWLWVPDPDKSYGSFDPFTLNEFFNREFPLRESERRCALTIGLMRSKQRERSQGVPILVCQWKSPGQRFIGLTLLRNRANVPAFTLLGRMAKEAAAPYAVQVRMGVSREASGLKLERGLLGQGWDYFRRLPQDFGQALMNSGLRYAHGEDASVLLTRLGGYRIELRQGQDTLEISGPGSVEGFRYVARDELR